MSERLDRVLEFCQKVRAAGGGDPLEALLPGVPSHADACLIARNLNFACEVGVGMDLTDYDVKVGDPINVVWRASSKAFKEPSYDDNHRTTALMFVTDDATRAKIVEALELKTVLVGDYEKSRVIEAILLPEEIGNTAWDFDRAWEDRVDKKENDLVKEFEPLFTQKI